MSKFQGKVSQARYWTIMALIGLLLVFCLYLLSSISETKRLNQTISFAFIAISAITIIYSPKFSDFHDRAFQLNGALKRSRKSIANAFFFKILAFWVPSFVYCLYLVLYLKTGLAHISSAILIVSLLAVLSGVLTLFPLLLALHLDPENSSEGNDEQKETPKRKKEYLVLAQGGARTRNVIDEILGQHQIFKNSSRNTTALRSLYIFGNLTLLIYYAVLLTLVPASLLNIEGLRYTEDFAPSVKSMIGIQSLIYLSFICVSILTSIYIFMDKFYKEKWFYCADKYYKYVEACRSDKEHFKISLAIDILQMDLWAKRGFYDFFYKVVSETEVKGQKIRIPIVNSETEDDDLLTESKIQAHLKSALKEL